MLPIIIAAKVGIKFCRYATECVSFVHVWMYLANQLELCLHEQTQIVASAACRADRQEFHSWIASLPFVSLLFIVIPTPFLIFKFLFISCLFTFYCTIGSALKILVGNMLPNLR